LHRVPRHVLDVVARNYAGGTSLGEYTRFWWVVFNLTFVAVAAGRLSIEMRRSVGASAWLVAAAAGYVLVGALELGYLSHPLPFVMVLMQSSAKMAGDAALLFAIGTYARYVYLDSQGILAQRRAEREARRRKARAEREARRQAKAEAKAAAAAEKAARKEAKRAAKSAPAAAKDESSEDEVPETAFTESKPTSPAPTPSKPPVPVSSKPPSSPPPPARSDDEDDEDDDADGDDRGMSRAERKRLKKLAKRDNRRAA